MPNPNLQATLHGYVFDGLYFVRACVNRNDRLVGKDNRVPVLVDPATAVWYTRREFQNAVAWCQSKGQMPKELDLNMVAVTAPLLARLTEQASLRKTQDHLLHMLTAGRERVLGRPFTQAEILGYQKQAAAWEAQLEAAYQKQVPQINIA